MRLFKIGAVDVVGLARIQAESLHIGLHTGVQVLHRHGDQGRGLRHFALDLRIQLHGVLGVGGGAGLIDQGVHLRRGPEAAVVTMKTAL